MTFPFVASSRADLAVLLALLTAGCSTLAPCPTADRVPGLAAEEVDSVLFLIGDAGEADPNGEAVLEALGSALREAVDRHGGERVRLVFLGDNIYPAGLPGEGSASEEAVREGRRRLADELAVLGDLPPAAEPVAIFVPGNHDWRGGVERLRNQASFVRDESGGRAELLPEVSCPGPMAVDVGSKLRIVALDTQWWLMKDPSEDGCEPASEEAVVSRLAESLREADLDGRRAVVVAHHPFLTGGPHGGTTLFLRRLGLIRQDVSHRRYREMSESIRSAFADHPPLVYAAGHDHSLQLLKGDAPLPFFAVSGAGSKKNSTAVGALDETLFCHQGGSGFMRLDFARDGRVRLATFLAPTVASSEAPEIYSALLAGE